MPTITHADLGEATCSESAVRLYEANGWKRKAAAKKSEAPAPAKKADSPAPNPTTKSPTVGEES